MRFSSSSLASASLLLGAVVLSCNSTETGNPATPKEPFGEPHLRSVPLELAVHHVGTSGIAGAPNDGPQLTGLTLHLAEVEAVDCSAKGTVSSFSQDDEWDSGNTEQVTLPRGSLCRLIVRALPIEQGTTPESTPGAYIEGESEDGPFRLMAPAPIGGFLELLDPQTDLTALSDLRLEVSEERLMADVETLLAIPGNGLLQPGSPETLQLSRALGDSLDLVQGVDDERRVLASGAEGPGTLACVDYCRRYEDAECSEGCDLTTCEQALLVGPCQASFSAWLGCIIRVPSQQLSCDAGILTDTDTLCASSRNAFELCQEAAEE